MLRVRAGQTVVVHRGRALRDADLDRELVPAGPLVPRPLVVAGLVPRSFEGDSGERRAPPGVAIDHHLRAFGSADDVAHVVRCRLRERDERDVAGAENVSLARIARITSLAAELVAGPDVEQDQVGIAAAPCELVELYVHGRPRRRPINSPPDTRDRRLRCRSPPRSSQAAPARAAAPTGTSRSAPRRARAPGPRRSAAKRRSGSPAARSRRPAVAGRGSPARRGTRP